MKSRETNASTSAGDPLAIQKELNSLKEQARRYNNAYGAGLFTLDQLREYTGAVNAKIAELESEVTQAQGQLVPTAPDVVPAEAEIDAFAAQARREMHNLSFAQKRAIVLNTVERIVGSQRELQVYGNIPITNYVEFKTNHRHGENTNRHVGRPIIPFSSRSICLHPYGEEWIMGSCPALICLKGAGLAGTYDRRSAYCWWLAV